MITQVLNKKWILFITPFAYFFLGSYIHQIIGLYSLRSVDPEYIYFINGLSLANGKLMLGHIDNPGTPLQYLAAMVFRILYELRLQQVPFTEDVIANADLYLRVLNLVLTALVAGFMYFAGKMAYRITNTISYSIIFQLAPLFTSIIFGNIGRVTPENLIPVPVMLLSLILMQIIWSNGKEISNKQAIWFALISAFGLSIKLTFLPILVIPFIVICKWKQRLIYSVTVTVSFFAMALPMTLQIKIFWGWVKDLFMHSGNYGKGESNIINWNTVIPNFKYLWTENSYYFYIIIALVLALLASLFIKKGDKTKILQRVSIAVLFSIAIQIVMVCKHFEYRYFYAALMLLPLSLILALEIIRPANALISRFKIPEVLILMFTLFYFNKQLPIIQSLSNHLDNEKIKKMPAVYYMQSIEKDAVKFIVPWYYGCPAPEYALMFSYAWAGKQREFYKPIFSKMYPDIYIYYSWGRTLEYWGSEPNIKETDKPVYIFLENDELKETFLADMKNYFPDKYDLTRTFFNETTKESVYRLIKVVPE